MQMDHQCRCCTGIQETTWSTKNELEEHSQQRSIKDGVTSKEAEVAVLDRHEWRRNVVLCVHIHCVR